MDRTCAQTMLYLTCAMISSVDLAHYGVSCAKDWVSVDCGSILCVIFYLDENMVNFLRPSTDFFSFMVLDEILL